jgi:2-(1,2-epoxy-1,2-dihydrophenyl)acetyl-CoA isomerase
MSSPPQSDAPPLLFERDGAVARLTLNRPAAANTIDLPLARELLLTAIACDEDDSIRCVVLTAAGRFFCSGGDIRSFVAAGASIAPLLKEMTACLHMAVVRFSHMNKPLITAVNGIAAGAGFSLALLGDLVLCFSSDGGLSWLLPRLVGLRRAQELMFTNRTVSAEEALSLGMVTRIVESESISQDARVLAQELASGPTGAYGKLRNLLLRSSDSSLESQLEEESRALAEASRTAHGREGVAAFIAKRKPDFSR